MEEDDAPRPVRRQRGSDTRVDPLPAVAPPASDAMMAFGRIAIVFTIAAWLAYVLSYFLTGIINSSYQNNERFLLGNYRLRRHHLLSRALRTALSGGPDGRAVPHPGAPPGAASGDRRILRHLIADHDGAGAFLPGGNLDDPKDPAVRGAAGVPVPAGGAAAGRPARSQVGGASRAAGERPAVVRRTHRVAGRAAGEVRRHPRAVRDLGTDRSRSGGRSRTDPGAGRRVQLGRGLAAHAGRRGDHRRPRRSVLRRPGAGGAGRRLRRGEPGPDDGAGGRGAPFRGRACCTCTAGWPGRSAAN